MRNLDRAALLCAWVAAMSPAASFGGSPASVSAKKADSGSAAAPAVAPNPGSAASSGSALSAIGAREGGSTPAIAGNSAEDARPEPTLILDAGHGGDDPGAEVRRIREKSICLAIVLKLEKALKRLRGPAVLLTRGSDVTVGLDQRVAKGAELKDAVFLSIHVNDSDHRRDRGFVVYAYGTITPAPKSRHRSVPPLGPPPAELASQSDAFASALARALRDQDFPVEGPVHSDYYVLKNPHHPSALVEVGYLSNARDRARLVRSDYQQKIADALARFLVRYFRDGIAPQK